MIKTPFKMKGFSGFGNSPVKNVMQLLNVSNDATTTNGGEDGGNGDGDGNGGELASQAGKAAIGAITSSMNQPPPKRGATQEGFTQMKIGV